MIKTECVLLECALLECDQNRMCSFWIVAFFCNVFFLERALWNVLFLQWDLNRLCFKWNVIKTECALFGMGSKWNLLFLDWLVAYFIIYFQIWPVSIVNRDKGLDDFIVAAPRFITLSARDRKTSILRAPINTLLYKKAQICANAYSIIKMGYVILFYLSRRRWNTSRKLWYFFSESKTFKLIISHFCLWLLFSGNFVGILTDWITPNRDNQMPPEFFKKSDALC